MCSVRSLSLRRFELLQVPHQETILPLNQKLYTIMDTRMDTRKDYQIEVR
jgi:hypothetical protein